VQGLLRDLDRSAIDLDSIEVHRPTLDDVFLSLTGRSLRDAEAAHSADATHAGGPVEPGTTSPQTSEGALR
jgi:ABC-2 type transport system ATP-binding protein